MAARRDHSRRRSRRARGAHELTGDKERNRTFPSLMSTPYDFDLLQWHATGQIAIVDVATGIATKFGVPGMITAVDMAPDGKYARVTRMKKPFSYIVPTGSFGSIEEVWDSTGKALTKLNERDINLGVQPDNLDPLAPPHRIQRRLLPRRLAADEAVAATTASASWPGASTVRDSTTCSSNRHRLIRLRAVQGDATAAVERVAVAVARPDRPAAEAPAARRRRKVRRAKTS